MSVKNRKVSTGDSYIDIARIAKELSIDYAGLSRQELVRQVNKKKLEKWMKSQTL